MSTLVSTMPQAAYAPEAEKCRGLHKQQAADGWVRLLSIINSSYPVCPIRLLSKIAAITKIPRSAFKFFCSHCSVALLRALPDQFHWLDFCPYYLSTQHCWRAKCHARALAIVIGNQGHHFKQDSKEAQLTLAGEMLTLQRVCHNSSRIYGFP